MIYAIGNTKPLEQLLPGELGLVELTGHGRVLAIGFTAIDGAAKIMIVYPTLVPHGAQSIRFLIIEMDNAWNWPSVLHLINPSIVGEPDSLRFDSTYPDGSLVVRTAGEPAMAFRFQAIGATQAWLDVGNGTTVPKDSAVGFWFYERWSLSVEGADDTGQFTVLFSLK